MRVSTTEMQNTFKAVLKKYGFTDERAELCARLFMENSRDGVYSHGLNRFPIFIENIRKGFIKVDAVPELVESFGVVERWDGNYGPGNLNAWFSMARAVEIAKKNGMGCVALRNTNHWMRAGTYGWEAADMGCIGICWTNTIVNMPPWGSVESKLGNNPLVLAVPRKDGHIVLDIAMAQFSYGQMQSYALRNEMLPFDGGYDKDGNITRDPVAVIESKRALPIGYWKGSGLSLLLDLIAVLISGGRSTYEIGKKDEIGLSQVFIAIDAERLDRDNRFKYIVEEILKDLHEAAPVNENSKVRYPGEGSIKTRFENEKYGIPVDPGFWQKVQDLLKE